MRLARLMNPLYVYERREHIVPFIKSQTHRLIRPVLNLPHTLAAHGFPVTANDRKLAALKDKHKGQRCFVIGNGPSLRISDLDQLKGEITFASNKIYLAFDQTSYRPTYYTVIDEMIAENWHEVINGLKLTKLFPSYVRLLLKPDKNTTYFESEGANLGGFSPDPLLEDLYGGYTVIFAQLQLAYYMGFKTVYLIGMDHTWNLPAGEREKQGSEVILVSQGEQNHFLPDYRLPGEKWSLPKPELQEIAFQIARKYYEDHGRCVYNATRGGRLEVFERVDLDQIIAESGLVRP